MDNCFEVLKDLSHLERILVAVRDLHLILLEELQVLLEFLLCLFVYLSGTHIMDQLNKLLTELISQVSLYIGVFLEIYLVKLENLLAKDILD